MATSTPLIWVQFGNKAHDKHVQGSCFNTDVDCNIFLDSLRCRVKESMEEYARQLDADIKMKLQEAREKIAALEFSNGQGSSEGDPASSDPQNSLEGLRAREAAYKTKHEGLAQEMSKFAGILEATLDLGKCDMLEAAPSPLNLSLEENSRKRASTLISPKERYVVIRKGEGSDGASTAPFYTLCFSISVEDEKGS